jgi:hypothetical protein
MHCRLALLLALLLAACGVPDEGPSTMGDAPTAAVEPASGQSGDASSPYPAPAGWPDLLDAYPHPTLAPGQANPAYPPPPSPPLPTSLPAQLPGGRQIVPRGGNLQLSPDGRYVVYIGDEDGDQQYELYSAPLDGGPSVRLDPEETPPEQIYYFAITADSRAVVYSWQGLYRVPIEGGQVVRVGQPATEFLLSPDSAWVVYWQHPTGLFSAPLGGGEPVRLGNGPSQSGHFAITPDSRLVVFVQTEQIGSSLGALYSVPIGGGDPVLLSRPASAGERVMAFTLTPDSRSVAYSTIPENGGMQSLYSASLDGGGPTVLWDRSGGESISDFFAVTADSSTVVFLVLTPGQDPRWRYYAAPVQGGVPVPLTELLQQQPRSVLTGVLEGSRIVYAVMQQGSSLPELYSVSRTGGPVTQLTGPRPFEDGNLYWHVVQQGDTVVLAADLQSPGSIDLYRVSAEGGPLVALSDPLPQGMRVLNLQTSADGTLAVYSIGWVGREPHMWSAESIHVVDLTGGAPARAIVDGGGIGGFILTPDGSRMIYQRDPERDGMEELFVVDLR